MIIDAVIQTQQENENKQEFFNRVITWCHQCYQRYTFDKDIDIEELKRRLNFSSIDYKKFQVDYVDELNLYGDLYLLRILYILFPEEYLDPDKE